MDNTKASSAKKEAPPLSMPDKVLNASAYAVSGTLGGIVAKTELKKAGQYKITKEPEIAEKFFKPIVDDRTSERLRIFTEIGRHPVENPGKLLKAPGDDYRKAKDKLFTERGFKTKDYWNMLTKDDLVEPLIKVGTVFGIALTVGLYIVNSRAVKSLIDRKQAKDQPQAQEKL